MSARNRQRAREARGARCLAALLAVVCAGCGAGASRSTGQATDRPSLNVLDYQWSGVLGGPGLATASAAAMDRDTLVVAGSFAGTWTLETRDGDLVLESAGPADAFVAGLGPDGRALWAHAWGGPGHDGAVAVAAGGDRIAVGLQVTPPATLAGQPLPGLGRPDAAVVVLARDGAMIRVHPITSSEHVRIADVAVAGDGAIAVAGAFAGTMRVGERVLTSAGATDAFAAWIAADGTLAWAVRAGGAGADTAQGVALGPGGPTVVGWFGGPVELDAAHAAGPGGFVLQLGPDGRPAWLQSLGPGAAAHAVAAAPAGDLYVAGHFHQTLALGSRHLDSRGQADAFVARLDARGAPVWSTTLGGPGSDHVRALTLARGSVIVAGTFEGQAAAGARELASAGAHDVFVAVLRAGDGAIAASRSLGGPEQDAAGGIAVSARGILTVTGSFAGLAAFGGKPHPAPGPRSVFVARFAL